MRDDRNIQRPKPASAPEKGRGPHCGKARRRATVCPCRCVPPGTEPPRKRSRWETSSGSTFLPSTCHSVPADVLAVNGSRQAVTWTMLPPFRPEEGSMKLCRGSPGFPCQSNRSAISAASILPARSSGTKDHRPTTSGALIAAGSILPCSVR